MTALAAAVGVYEETPSKWAPYVYGAALALPFYPFVISEILGGLS